MDETMHRALSLSLSKTNETMRDLPNAFCLNLSLLRDQSVVVIKTHANVCVVNIEIIFYKIF